MIRDQQDDRSTSPRRRVDARGVSKPFVSRWHRLVSMTNWEKGRIICEWREALIRGGAPVTAYSDEAWSRRVGNVSSQHVGRLRRVYQRFADVYSDYAGLYWSHFQAAREWNDAELWLEGGVQNDWSVSQMRAQRWRALGAPESLKPRDEDIITAELDEDVDLMWDARPAEMAAPATEVQEPGRPRERGGRNDDGADAPCSEDRVEDQRHGATDRGAGAMPRCQPLGELPELPNDLSAALDALKHAILKHRLDDWTEVARDDVLRSLEALRQLVLAPVDT